MSKLNFEPTQLVIFRIGALGFYSDWLPFISKFSDGFCHLLCLSLKEGVITCALKQAETLPYLLSYVRHASNNV